MLYHIIEEAVWDASSGSSHYGPADLTEEGFIHLSRRDQILRPANLLYKGRQDLRLLVIDPAKLEAEVIDEPGSHGEAELFPHLYGPLNIDAVVEVVDFPCGPDGAFVLPEDL